MPKNSFPLKTQGIWSWKPELLFSKMRQGPEDECWQWLGSQGPHANLFGARKNGRPQMTQAARIIYAEYTGQDIEHLEIRHTCGNRYCCNPRHFLPRANHMTKPKQPKEHCQDRLIQRRLQPLTDKEWWEI